MSLRLSPASFLCFVGWLRVSEPLKLRFQDVVFSEGSLVVLLGRTKRGFLQRVLIRDVFAAEWMRRYMRECPSRGQG